MKIKDKPNYKTKPKPLMLAPDNKVRMALDIMCEKNIGSIVVVDVDQHVVGIITERDMMVRVLGKNINPDITKLADVMSKNVRVANENDSLVDWMHVMSNEHFRHLPVLDDQGNLVSVMSQGDFVAHTFPDLYEALRQDIKGRLGRGFQYGLVIFAVITLGLIIFNS